MKNQKGNIGVMVSFIIVVILIGAVIYALMHKTVETDSLEGVKNVNSSSVQVDVENPTNTTVNENPNTSNKNMQTNTRTLKDFTPIQKTTELEKIDLVVGKGDEVQPGATVSVHYTGAVAATGEVFQSSKDFGLEPITFPLSQVIKGWTDGIPGMKIGGTRRLIIPSDQAYGANPPAGAGIPANADLVFDVELVATK